MSDQPNNDKKSSGEDFPGYPHHPASEDITNPANRAQRVPVDPNDMGPNARHNSVEQRDSPMPAPRTDGETDPDADVTEEDVKMLSASFQNRDMDDADKEEPLLDDTDEDGDPLNEPRATYGQTGADLDVPGSETDNGNEDIGEEDEENNYYSLGGDNKENLEEDNSI